MKKILLSIVLFFGLGMTVSAQQDWNNEYESNVEAPVIHRAGALGEDDATNGEAQAEDPTNPTTPTPPPSGTSPVGALALPFAAMLGLYGVAALRKKEE